MDWTKLIGPAAQAAPDGPIRTSGLCWWCDTPLPQERFARWSAILGPGQHRELHHDCLTTWRREVAGQDTCPHSRKSN